MTVHVRDIWADLGSLFQGQSERINEIELTNIKRGSMSLCLYHIMHIAKESNFRFTLTGKNMQVMLPSPHTVVNYVLQGQVSVAMWITLPALPMVSIYVDYTDEISFGYVRGTWNAMDVLAFFDLLYELKNMAPGSRVRPNHDSFTPAERNRILEVWQDYEHQAS